MAITMDLCGVMARVRNAHVDDGKATNGMNRCGR